MPCISASAERAVSMVSRSFPQLVACLSQLTWLLSGGQLVMELINAVMEKKMISFPSGLDANI